MDRRDERVQLIVDDCRAVDDLNLLLVQLPSDQASDIAVQHKLRECLTQHRPDREELGVKVPVIAEVSDGTTVRYVRLGPQFFVRNVDAAIESLVQQDFSVRRSENMVIG